MSTKKHLVAFAAFAIIVPPLCAETMIVKFDDLLTNETNTARWEYTNVKSGNNGHYIASHNSSIKSQQFNFAVTSVTVCVSLTSACNRNLVISPLALLNESPAPHCEFSNIPRDTETNLVANWEAASRVRLFTITTTSGNSGNIYLKSAVISGVPLIEPPTNLQTNDITGTRCRLSWTNPANAVSNRIDVSRVVNHEMAGEVLDDYDFAEFTNSGGNPIDRTADFIAQYPNFAGSSLIYIPAYTTGNIQISTDNQKGFLVHAGLSDCSDVTLLLSLKIPNNSQGMTFGIGYEAATGVTNEVATIPMDLEFKTNRVSIAKIPADTPIIFNTQGANSKRRVIIDYLAFVHDYGPAYAETNLVKTVFATGNAARIRGLSPYSSYIASITAFDADGNESEPSEPISFMTNGAELPLVIRLQ